MKTKEFVAKDEKHNNKKGFQLIVKNLDTGKDEFNVTTRAIVGAYAIDIGINGTMSAGGVVVTSCDTQTFIGTIEAAERTVAKAKETVIKQEFPKILAEILGGKNE